MRESGARLRFRLPDADGALQHTNEDAGRRARTPMSADIYDRLGMSRFV